MNVDFPLSRDGNGDHMCRKRVKDSRNKLTVGDVRRTLCEQKETSLYVLRIVTETRQNSFLDPPFTAKKFRIGSFRLDYEYEIEYEYDFSILVFRLHIVTTHTHFIR